MKFDNIGDFLDHYEGQGLKNSKGGYQGECVSLIPEFFEDPHGVDHDAWGNAIDYQNGGIGGQKMAANGFSWNTDHNFENGDILVWGDGAQTSSYGHIGIYYEGQVWQQNFDGDRTLHTYDGLIDAYIGYWRASDSRSRTTKAPNHNGSEPSSSGGGKGTRTPNPLLAKPVVQLRHTPKGIHLHTESGVRDHSAWAL